MSLLKKLGFGLIAMVIGLAGCGEMDANEFEAGTPGEATGVILDTLGDQLAFMKYAAILASKPPAAVGPIAAFLGSGGAATNQTITIDPANTTGQAGNLLAPSGIYKITIGGAIDADTDNDGDVDASDNALLWSTTSTTIPLSLSFGAAPTGLPGATVIVNVVPDPNGTPANPNDDTMVYLGLRKANLDDYITSGILKVVIRKYEFTFYSQSGLFTDLVPYSTDAIYSLTGDLKEVVDVGRISLVNYSVARTYNFLTKVESVQKFTTFPAGTPNFIYFNIPSTTAFLTAAATNADILAFCTANASYEGSSKVVLIK